MKLRERPVLILIAGIFGYLIGRAIFPGGLFAARNRDTKGSNSVMSNAPAIDSDRSEDFKGGYQTVVAIIQGVAFGALALSVLPTMRASIEGGQIARSVTIAMQALVTLIAIIIVTDSYFYLTGTARWDPTILDTAVPYLLGSSEVAVGVWVGNNTLWWAALSSLLLASAAAFKYSSIRVKAQEFIDTAERRLLMKDVRDGAKASLATLTFSVAVCLLSIYTNLSAWLYAIAPLVAAAVYTKVAGMIART